MHPAIRTFNRGRSRGVFAPSTGQFGADLALQINSRTRPSAVLADLVQADRSVLQKLADEAGFLLLLESSVKR
jgi:hypothetical protein